MNTYANEIPATIYEQAHTSEACQQYDYAQGVYDSCAVQAKPKNVGIALFCLFYSSWLQAGSHRGSRIVFEFNTPSGNRIKVKIYQLNLPLKQCLGNLPTNF